MGQFITLKFSGICAETLKPVKKQSSAYWIDNPDKNRKGLIFSERSCRYQTELKKLLENSHNLQYK